MGRSSGANRVWTWVSQARCGRARRLTEPKPHRNGRMRCTHKQCQVGESSRQRLPSAALNRTFPGFRRQRLADRDTAQGLAYRTHREVASGTAWVGAFWDRYCAWSIARNGTFACCRPITACSRRATAMLWDGYISGRAADASRWADREHRHGLPPA